MQYVCRREKSKSRIVAWLMQTEFAAEAGDASPIDVRHFAEQ